MGSIPARGAKILHASQPKNQNIKQKQYGTKFNKDLKKKLPIYGTTMLFCSEGHFWRIWFPLEKCSVFSILSSPPSPGWCLSVREGSDNRITNGGGMEVTWRNTGSSLLAAAPEWLAWSLAGWTAATHLSCLGHSSCSWGPTPSPSLTRAPTSQLLQVLAATCHTCTLLQGLPLTEGRWPPPLEMDPGQRLPLRGHHPTTHPTRPMLQSH